jgi:AmmeMemoRadiSam system protein A
LAELVAEMAVAAGTRDPRFPPVQAAELDQLLIEVSILSPPEACEPDDIVVGRDGLVVQRGRRRGLLLPQVATERGWSRDQFLDATCRKAGLPVEAWRDGVELFRFEALHFEEVV